MKIGAFGAQMSVPRQYRFDDRLAMSQGVSANRSVSAILLRQIPGALSVARASENEDRAGTDWWVDHVSGRRLSVDCKVREQDWSVHPNPEYRRDDLAIETWSVMEKKVIGWSRDPHKRTDYILWLWKDTGRWCLVPFVMLCAVCQDHWQEWVEKYREFVHEQKTPERGYRSQCVMVLRREIWKLIYERYAGSPRN